MNEERYQERLKKKEEVDLRNLGVFMDAVKRLEDELQKTKYDLAESNKSLSAAYAEMNDLRKDFEILRGEFYSLKTSRVILKND